MLVDANILLYAVDTSAVEHGVASRWLEEQLNGNRRVGLPWESLGAFVRIATHPRAARNPLTAEQAWDIVEAWLGAPAAWIPLPTDQHVNVLGDLMRRYRVTGNLVSDAHLAALALEHGLELCSADTDFAQFRELRWRNPMST